VQADRDRPARRALDLPQHHVPDRRLARIGVAEQCAGRPGLLQVLAGAFRLNESLDCAFHFNIADRIPDFRRHERQLFVSLFDVSMWVELRNLVQWDKMEMNMGHTEAFDGDADSFSISS
jgi:hypothetical protein